MKKIGAKKAPLPPKTKRIFTKKKTKTEGNTRQGPREALASNTDASSTTAESSTTAATAAAKLKELKPVQLLRKARDLLAQQDKYRSSIAQLKADLKSSNA